MKIISFSNKQMTLLEKCLRIAIADLQCERHQAMKHGFDVDTYNKEIEEIRDLKKYIFNDTTTES